MGADGMLGPHALASPSSTACAATRLAAPAPDEATATAAGWNIFKARRSEPLALFEMSAANGRILSKSIETQREGVDTVVFDFSETGKLRVYWIDVTGGIVCYAEYNLTKWPKDDAPVVVLDGRPLSETLSKLDNSLQDDSARLAINARRLPTIEFASVLGNGDVISRCELESTETSPLKVEKLVHLPGIRCRVENWHNLLAGLTATKDRFPSGVSLSAEGEWLQIEPGEATATPASIRLRLTDPVGTCRGKIATGFLASSVSESKALHSDALSIYLENAARPVILRYLNPGVDLRYIIAPHQ